MAFASPIKAALGRTAFVTGGGQGIGRAIATRLARDGYDVSIADIPAAKDRVADVLNEIQGYGRRAISVEANVKEPKQIYAAIQETVDRLGPNLFVSVANAGVTQVKPLLECEPE